MPGVIERVEKIKLAHRIVIFAVTVVVLVAAFAFLVYIPKSDKISGLKKDITSLDQKLRIARLKEKKLEKFEEERKQVEKEFKEALELLPNAREIPSLLRNITKLGKDSRLQFELFQLQRERPQGFYFEIPVSIQVNGRYHDVAVFFDKVGRMPRIVNITKVSMQPVKPLSSMLSTKCEAVTYRFREKGSEDKKGKRKK